MTTNTDPVRQAKLTKLFEAAVYGRSRVVNARQCSLFIEALCGQDDAVDCVYKLTTSSSGHDCIKACVRSDLSTEFLNDHGTKLLQYFSNPSIASIDSGTVLKDLLALFLDPPFFWSAMLDALRKDKLTPDALHSFAWLLCEVLHIFPAEKLQPFLDISREKTILAAIAESKNLDTRNLGQRIQHLALLHTSPLQIVPEDGPGGRHDNDFISIRDIRVLPTGDELLSGQPPFLRLAEEVSNSEVPKRERICIDNQFRLLREDMIKDLREEIQAARSGTKKFHHSVLIGNMALSGIDCLDVSAEKTVNNPYPAHPRQWRHWGVKLRSPTPLPGLEKMQVNARFKFLSNQTGPGSKILRHLSLACVLADGQVAGFGYIHRDVDLLSQNWPEFIVQVEGNPTAFLQKMHGGTSIELVQVNTAVFAYEPFLRRLQQIREVPLSEALMHWGSDSEPPALDSAPFTFIERLRRSQGKDLKDIFDTMRSVNLDESQFRSLLAGLILRVSLIQGPPGTGKSFLGALLAKAIYNSTTHRILVICFTNHAVHQFVEDLLDIGIPPSEMVLLASKASDRTEPLLIRGQKSSFKPGKNVWSRVNIARIEMTRWRWRLYRAFKEYTLPVSKASLIDYLEFLDGPYPFFEAFKIPLSDNGMQRVGKKGKTLSPHYLLDRWLNGKSDAGTWTQQTSAEAVDIWKMSLEVRQAHHGRWTAELKREALEEIGTVGDNINRVRDEIHGIFEEHDKDVLMSMRIIACTTTKAAMYSNLLQKVSPEVVLVEEAGEILEAHVLTSLGPKTKQLIMIGDHLQLRPKIQNYNLGVEKGDGYDLNRSLFERLVLKGYPHETLTKQHRMRPEISAMVRHLTYPDLEDADTTLNRPDIRGLRNNVIFVDHREPETFLKGMRERQAGSSKQNRYEALLVLKYVKYLAQQGYGSNDIVVLTPYLGQLRLLQEELRQLGDPVLNDLDRYDLMQAGLVPIDSSSSKERSVHLSTIDNYQGEEKPIVVASLTRSNEENDIGFMFQPERLNVLLSRAQNGLIIIGNFNTFRGSKKGKLIWNKLYEFVQGKGHIYQGLPVKCESHPDRIATLVTAEDFETVCPDGGCSEPCGVLLSCGVHKCPSRCHAISDHSKMLCKELLSIPCSKGHPQTWPCHNSAPLACLKCEREDERLKKKAKAAFNQQQKKEAAAQQHAKELEVLDQQIEDARQRLVDTRLRNERTAAVNQRRRDLEAALNASVDHSRLAVPPHDRQSTQSPAPNPQTETGQDGRKQSTSPALPNGAGSAPDAKQPIRPAEPKSTLTEETDRKESTSEAEWSRQKRVENANNDAIDKIMDLVGLEDVKKQVLSIKMKLDTSARQGLDLTKERYHVSFLGNPGTGKTTVARFYGQFLSSMGALPAHTFVETSGSKLANEGVAGAQKLIQQLLNGDGGVLFVDEAYQLTGGDNYGGKSVLDFLLTEIENLTGKVAFIFAGYAKPMETFFAHNPGLPSRVPYTLSFTDYEDNELLIMLEKLFTRRYAGKAVLECGYGGLYARILVRRLGRSRGREGFGNMRDLENIFSRVCERQAIRLSLERRSGQSPNDFGFTMEDLIGPDPAAAVTNSKAWTKLQELIGLKEVKTQVGVLLTMIKTNYRRELQEMEPIQMSLNRVFLGSPGTGKTSVAKLYGQILVDLGLLSNGEVVLKNPSDFIGAVLGSSEQNTKNILQASKGKVLIIDEAYMLGPAGEASGGADTFKTAVIDTMVAEIQSTPGEDRCVLLLGYEDQMRRMFQAVNAGLTRRFPLDDAFRFHDFDDTELQKILDLKLKQQDLTATPEAVAVAIDLLSRERNGLNFGNAGSVENLISKAKTNCQNRMSTHGDDAATHIFEFAPQDFDTEYDRATSAEDSLRTMFEDTVGSEEIIQQMDYLQKLARGTKAQKLDPREYVPTNFIFKGPPGTGKTTTARKIGRVFYDMGFLSNTDVVECSASDLIGEYVGHTGPKTRRQLEKGLGRVLFIDEAYRLGEGHFATEAVNELVDLLTKPEFKGKLIVILAGYEDEMNRLMNVNPGLSSRFPEVVMFRALTASQCTLLMSKVFQSSRIECSELQPEACQPNLEVEVLFEKMMALKSWGNGRDVQSIAKKCMRSVFTKVVTSTDATRLSIKEILDCMEAELSERLKREDGVLPSKLISDMPTLRMQSPPLAPTKPQIQVGSTTETNSHEPEEAAPEQGGHPAQHERDPGVSDAVWTKLQADTLANQQALQAAEANFRKQEAETERAANEVSENTREIKQLEKALQPSSKKNPRAAKEDDEAKRRLEAARIARVKAQAEWDAEQKRLEDLRKRQQDEKRAEALKQVKLRQMGVCPVGYRWIKQSGGYRCAGGSHFVTDDQLGS